MIKVYIILGSFCCIFREKCLPYVINYTRFCVLHMGMVLLCVFAGFWIFLLFFNPRWVYFDSYGHPRVAMPVEEREEQKNTKTVDTRVCPWRMPWSMVSLFPVKLFIFSRFFNFQAVFNVIYTCGCSTSSSFAIKRGSHPHFTTSTIPSISFPLLKGIRI